MRVALVNTSDAKGGAARAAYRLHKGLRQTGVESTYYVRDQTLNDETIRRFVPDPSSAAVQERTQRQMEWESLYQAYAPTRSPHIELFSPASFTRDENFFVQLPRADVVNLHWVSKFVDVDLFFSDRLRQPAVWTLHDMNPFTGGCHYDQGCGKYTSTCGACPLLGSKQSDDLSRKIFEAKAKSFASWPANRLHIVTPSAWLAHEVRTSTLLSKFDVSVIPNSIETDIFRPSERNAARQALKLPLDSQIVLFVSNHIGLARKGFRELLHALSLIPDTSRLLLLGVGDSHIKDFEAPFKVEQVEHVNDDATMAMVYAAADVTAIPSLQDNLPNTILESLSCGTPVVGFEVGGLPDVIKTGQTGFLAASGRVSELSLAFIDAFSDMERLKAMGQTGRKLIGDHYSLAAQGEAYTELFERSITEAARI